MNELDRFAVTVRLAAAEQDAAMRAATPDDDLHKRPRHKSSLIDRLLTLIAVGLLVGPALFFVLRSL